MEVRGLPSRTDPFAAPGASPLTSMKQDMQKAVVKLPKGTETCIVEGGNHRGFASYGRQPLDWEVREDLLDAAHERVDEAV